MRDGYLLGRHLVGVYRGTHRAEGGGGSGGGAGE